MKKIFVIIIISGLAGCGLFFPPGMWNAISNDPTGGQSDWYKQLNWSYETTASANIMLKDLGVAADADHWYIKVSTDLSIQGILPSNGGISATILIDNTDITNGHVAGLYSFWGLPVIDLDSGFTPDYIIPLKSEVPPLSINGLDSLQWDHVEIFKYIGNNTLHTTGFAFSNVANLNGLNVGKIYSINQTNKLAGCDAAFENGTFYLKIAKSVLPVSALKVKALVWSASTNWDGSGPAGAVETIPRESYILTNYITIPYFGWVPSTNMIVFSPVITTPVGVIQLNSKIYNAIASTTTVWVSIVDSGILVHTGMISALVYGRTTNFNLGLWYDHNTASWTNNFTVGLTNLGADVEDTQDFDLIIRYVPAATGKMISNTAFVDIVL